MQRQNLDENGAFPVVNFIGIILGFASLSTLLIVQSLNIPTTTIVCPYGMCDPVVCALRIKPKLIQ